MLFRILVLALVAGGLAFSQVGKADSYVLSGGMWKSMPVNYCVNPSGGPVGPDGELLLSEEAFVDLVQQAFQKWQDDPNSSLRFISDGVCANVPSKQDDVNTIGWRDLKTVPAIGAAFQTGQGKYLRGGSAVEIMEADIVLNSRVDSYEDLDYYLNTILPHTILHEIGHFIGLGHSTVNCTVMVQGPIYPLELCKDDTDAAAWLYP